MGRKHNPLTAIDLFSGCGGLSAGLKLAGFRILFAVEEDSSAADSYHLNHPDVDLIEEDIRHVNVVSELEERGIGVGELDLLAACPPCQGFSSIRTLNASRKVADERNDLVLTVSKLVSSVRPRTIMFENVPGLRTDGRFSKLLRSLKRDRYDVRWKIVDAVDFGVPQYRRRLILLASRVGIVKMPRRSRTIKTVADAISDLPVPSPHFTDALHRSNKRTARVETIIRAIPKNGGSRSALPRELVLDCHRRTTGFRDVYGRLSWDAPANTITSGCTNPSKGRFLHPDQHRVLTLREAALLQGFPKHYKFPSLTKTEIARQIGNAIPPPFARAQALALVDNLESY